VLGGLDVKVEDWQRQEAAAGAPHWQGDLGDDCTAHWAGLTLRAEWMDGRSWWWAIADYATSREVDTSNNYPGLRFKTADEARAAAEDAARVWLGVPESTGGQ